MGSDRNAELDRALAELIRRLESDESFDAERFIRRHAEFADELGNFFSQRGRIEKIVKPIREATERALNIRCPHCRNAIELVDQLITEISCPSCGSAFSLVGDSHETTRRTPRELGHFALLEQVGVGQFGSVWRARDTKLDRTVAVKIPRRRELDVKETEMFLRDARAAAQLRHPNIVGVHEVGKDGETIYIVSDFIQGVSLRDWLTHRRVTPREAAEIVEKIARALHHAHEAGVIHRDLKPSNIMMDAKGDPHVVDFGLAKRDAGEVTMTVEGQILGTPAYMSPEQASGRGHEADRSTDIYSLAVILFELLTGELPFRGDRQLLILQIIHEDPPSPRTLNFSTPRDLETVCLACLEKDPRQRFYRTAEQLADDLARYQAGEDIHARPLSQIVRSWRWVDRHRSFTALLASSLCVIFLAVALVTRSFYSSKLESANRGLQTALDAAEKAQAKADRLRRIALINERRAKEFMYSAHIVLAENAIDSGENQQAYSLLQPFRSEGAELRGPEWTHLWTKIRGNEFELSVNDLIRFIAFERDGRRLVSADKSGELLRWDLIDKTVSARSDQPDEMTGLIAHPGHEGVIIIDTRKDAYHWLGQNELPQKTERPDGVADAQWEQIRAPHYSDKVLSVVSQNGQVKAVANKVTRPSASRASIWLRMTATNERAAGDIAVEGDLQSLAISADGKRLAVGGVLHRRDRPRQSFVRVYDLENENDAVDFACGSATRIGCLAFSSDGRRLAAAVDKTIKVWRLDEDDLVVNFEESARYSTITFDPTGQHLVTLHKEKVVIRDGCTGEAKQTLNSESGVVYDACFDSGGKTMALACQKGVELWNFEPRRVVKRLERSHCFRVQFGPNDRQLAAAGMGTAVWRLPEGRLIFSHLEENFRAGWTTGLAFNANGERLATSKRFGQVVLWDTTTWQPCLEFDAGFWALKLTYTPDGEHLVAGGHDADVWFWCGKTGRVERTIPTSGSSTDLLYTCDGRRLLVGHAGGKVSIVNARTGGLLTTIPDLTRRAAMSTVAATRDGSRLAFNSNGRVQIRSLTPNGR